MTDEKAILMQIQQLPEKLKVEVLHYIKFLQKEYSNTEKPTPKKKRKAGSARGKYKIAPDFDVPLEDLRSTCNAPPNRYLHFSLVC